MRASQKGASGLAIAFILVLLAVVLLASRVLVRLAESSDDRNQSIAGLDRAANAIEQFAASNQRLPCPANPADSTGLEVFDTGAKCSFGSSSNPDGSVPWKSIGLNSDQALDAWGRKISYKVYFGNNGSLTQAGGISMVQCDLVDGASAGPTAVAGGQNTGGLCRSSDDPYQRNTTAAEFLAGKGLNLTDKTVTPNVVHSDVAYVLISHGPTGLGGYTVSGVQLTPTPSGDERNNTRDDNFVVAPFSSPDIAATDNSHFDDFVLYRSLPDLVKRANLSARDWPEGTLFNSQTMAAAGTGGYGDKGVTLTFMGNTATASGGDVAFTSVTSGAQTYEGVGVTGGAGNMLQTGESLRFTFNSVGAHLGITLANFGTFTFFQKYREQFKAVFYDASGNAIGTAVTKQGCNLDGGLASFVVEPPVLAKQFKSVDVIPLTYSPNFFSVSSQFLISEIVSCTGAPCTTTLSNSTNKCSAPSLTTQFSPTSVNAGIASSLLFKIANGADAPTQDSIAFAVALPQNLAIASPANVVTDCPTAGGSGAPSFTVTTSAPTPPATSPYVISVQGLSINNSVTSCYVSVDVVATSPATYLISTESITGIANASNGVTDTTLSVQP